jgi:hypothetical protein
MKIGQICNQNANYPNSLNINVRHQPTCKSRPHFSQVNGLSRLIMTIQINYDVKILN